MVKQGENKHKKWTVIGAWIVSGVAVFGMVALHWSSLLCIIISGAYDEMACEGSLLSSSEDLRNLAWVLAAVIAFPIFVWRGWVGDQQATTDARRELQESFQNAAEMLASKENAARFAGIYALDRIARENVNRYHMQIIQLLCAFVRYAGKPEKREVTGTRSPNRCHSYVETAMVVIGQRSEEQRDLEKNKEWRLKLEQSYLRNAWLRDANLANARLLHAELFYAQMAKVDLSGASLSGANMEKSNLKNANLTGASLGSVNLTQADLTDADLTKAKLPKANLTAAILTNVDLTATKLDTAKGLTQAQLDTAKALRGHGPDLPGGLEFKEENYYDDDVPY